MLVSLALSTLFGALFACDRSDNGDRHRLTVNRSGAGQVQSAPNGIDCGLDCTGTYPSGTSVTLTATAAPGGAFHTWAGACSEVDEANQCLVILERDTSVRAYFTGTSQGVGTLAVVKQGDGSGVVTSSPGGIDCGGDCSHGFPEGTEVELLATPDEGSAFDSWQGCDTVTDQVCLVELEGDETVTATFTLIPSGTGTLSVLKEGDGSGVVTSSPDGIDCGGDCSHGYPEGTEVELLATPDEGSTFDSWQGCDRVTGDVCLVELGGDETVTATFRLIPPEMGTLKVLKQGDGSGIVTSSPDGIDCGGDCSHDYPDGTEVELLPTPEPGSAFDSWQGCDATDDDACAVTMNADKVVTAIFTEVPGVHDVTVTPGSAELELGQAVHLTAEVEATGGADATVTWQSSHTGVATVDSSGLVETVGEGEATITATSTYDPTVSDTASVTVVSEHEGVRIAATASTCDGSQVGAECKVSIHLIESSGDYAGFEFMASSAGFTLSDAEPGGHLEGGNCLIAAGEHKVIGVCEENMAGDGEIAVLTLERTAAEAATLTVHGAYLATDAETKNSVGGGTLGIAGSE